MTEACPMGPVRVGDEPKNYKMVRIAQPDLSEKMSALGRLFCDLDQSCCDRTGHHLIAGDIGNTNVEKRQHGDAS